LTFKSMASSGIPLRLRLALGSAVLLSLAISAFGIIAYETSKRGALEAAEGRARAAVLSLATRSSLSLREAVRPLSEAAADPAVIEALRSGVPSEAAHEVLARLPADSVLSVAVGLRSRSGQVVLSLNRELPTWAFDESESPDSAGFGRARVRSDSIWYEVTAPVYDRGTLLGDVVRVRRVRATRATVETVSDLMGEDGALLFGNQDGSLWTDLRRTVDGPPGQAVNRYRKEGRDFIVAISPLPGTPYLFAAEFPVAAVLAPARTLVRDFIAIGVVLVGFGLVVGGWASTRVTKPLTELTQAAEAITAGNRPGAASGLAGGDELVRLQRAFQAMTNSVRQAREELERQVQDRTRALEDLRASEEALRVADRRKDDFLAMLAHELRNPLAPIRNAVHLFKLKSPSDPDLAWGRDVIDRQVVQMSRLLDDLLDVSRISHNRLELRMQRVDLASVLTSAIETSRPLIDGAGHELTVVVPPEPLYLDADPVRLAQVFSNLLNNSARYTTRSGHIRVSAEQQNGEVQVSVADDGVGITPEALPHVFDMFTQVKPSLDGGLGIGLALARGLVGLHGGQVFAESDGPGRGSTFTVRLPLAAAVPVSEPAEPDGDPGPTVQRRLLIVDDLEDAANSLATLLRLEGHEVWTAHDGAEAFDAADLARPEIVLLDLGMPKVDGYETCRRIRRQAWGRAMTIIAVTGWGQVDDRRRTAEAGFDLHLVKPVDPARLLKLLDSGPDIRCQRREGASRQ
jgi:signal transduction histidine kinase/ActR/RegA family two-component response regulator